MLINEVIGGLGTVYYYKQEILSLFGQPVQDVYKTQLLRRVNSVLTSVSNTTVRIMFDMPNGKPAKAIWQLKSGNTDEFKRKILSASYTIESPRPGRRTFERADILIYNGVGQKGIAILTNPKYWNLVGFQIQDTVAYGEQK